MKVQDLIVEKTLKNGMYVEIRLVRLPRQLEAALFLDGRFKPGPPIPRPLDNPTGDVTHWMGVRPSIGLTAEEADKIAGEVNVQNFLHKLQFVDRWGKEEE
ncbi:hypothetical protein [Geobacter argillaceus]|nr:hypothetical protein [Geobacter argillaceus]